MNDIHRYRVWDDEKKVYAHEGYIVTQFGLVGTYDPFVGLIRNINCIVERCTGLKDKNGKLIFEGDAVKTVTGAIGIVCFIKHCAGFYLRLEDATICRFSLTSAQEVIGNVHEMEAAE